MTIHVSVIIPVYNSERYLADCVESLLNQTLKQVEFIFVDDGSTDSSYELLQNYQKQDSRIILIKQKNSSAGAARNRGLKEAKGKYVIFVDSDDFFLPSMLEMAFKYAEKNNAQVAIFDNWYYDDKQKRALWFRRKEFPRMVFSAEDCSGKLFQICFPAPWNKLFLKSFIEENGFAFQEIRKCNDVVFVLSALAKADRIASVPRRLLYYRINNEQSLQGRKTGGCRLYIDCAMALKESLESRDLFSRPGIRETYDAFAAEQISHGLNRAENVNEFNDFFSYVKKHLIPDLFASEEEFEYGGMYSFYSQSFYTASCSEGVLLTILPQIQAYMEETRTYKLGEKILRIPKALANMLANSVFRVFFSNHRTLFAENHSVNPMR